MSVHIGAQEGQIAETVLLPGDPLRAKYIAEKFLEDVELYNEVRGMYGFTGTYKGKRISVQGTGMGVPSMSIYVNELIMSYGAKNLIRVGTAGGIQEDVKVRDVVIAMSASSEIAQNRVRFNGMDYAPTATFDLLHRAYMNAEKAGIPVKVGQIFTADQFYQDDFHHFKKWADFGCLAIEMEAAGLYTLAAKHKVNALTILTISDHLLTGEETTAEERQTTFDEMIRVALDTAVEVTN